MSELNLQSEKEEQEAFEKLTTEQQTDLYNALFSKLMKQPILNPNNIKVTSKTFTKYNKEDVIRYLKNPDTNQKNVRNASIYIYNTSSQYKRLLDYFANLPTWSYVLLPYKFDIQKAKKEAVYKQYLKTIDVVENMNIKHEFRKVLETALREDVFYGLIWETSDSFFIQKLNPDYCMLYSIEDGVYTFVYNMSTIQEEDIIKYPVGFQTLYNQYKSDGVKWKEVTSDIGICIKANESVDFPLPIFAGVLAGLYDIEDYKELMKQRTEVGNYKALNMIIGTDSNNKPTMEYPQAKKYFNMMCNVLPDSIGAILSPMKIESIDFQKSGNMTDADEVNKSVEQFWQSTGTTSLLFGGGEPSSSSLNLAIKTDEEIIFALLSQFERWVNLKLKKMTGTIKFKINFLPVTVFNKEEMLKFYKESATYGVPVKSYISATLGQTPADMLGANYIEQNVLNLSDSWIPLHNTHTESSDDESQVGNPTNASQGKGLTDSGEQTQESGANNDR